MDMLVIGKKAGEIIKKYRYVLIILVVGVLLMLIPEIKTKNKTVVESAPIENQIDTTAQLQQLLEAVSGAGKVRVLLTCSSGEKIIYQTDENTSKTENGTTEDRKTVNITNDHRAEQGLISQVIPPEYLGAVIVCQGAEKPAVRLAVTEAVSAATGLGADRIVVLKMK